MMRRALNFASRDTSERAPVRQAGGEGPLRDTLRSPNCRARRRRPLATTRTRARRISKEAEGLNREAARRRQQGATPSWRAAEAGYAFLAEKIGRPEAVCLARSRRRGWNCRDISRGWPAMRGPQTARDEDGRLPEDRAQAARQEQEGGREEEPAEDGLFRKVGEESACRVTAKLLKKMIDQEKAQLSDIRE